VRGAGKSLQIYFIIVEGGQSTLVGKKTTKQQNCVKL
jgi:hypothetical protein